jgi:hypothetical protein
MTTLTAFRSRARISSRRPTAPAVAVVLASPRHGLVEPDAQARQVADGQRVPPWDSTALANVILRVRHLERTIRDLAAAREQLELAVALSPHLAGRHTSRLAVSTSPA